MRNQMLRNRCASLEASRSHLASVEFPQSLLADRKTKNPQSHVCGFFLRNRWRRKPESNRRTRICNPLHNHSAIAPALARKKEARCWPLLPFCIWSGRRVSNSRPQPWQGCALPTELLPRRHCIFGVISDLVFRRPCPPKTAIIHRNFGLCSLTARRDEKIAARQASPRSQGVSLDVGAGAVDSGADSATGASADAASGAAAFFAGRALPAGRREAWRRA